MEDVSETWPDDGQVGGERSFTAPLASSGASMVTSFNLAGCQWSVEEVNGLSEMGHTDPEDYVIRLRSTLCEQAKNVTFYHELVHAILFTMGRTDHPEDFVDSFGNLLYQYLNTVE
jgi:hypothetical protein